MPYRPFCTISGLLFTIVALAHMCRLVFDWQILVDETEIPMWVPWFGLAIPGMLACWAFSLTRRENNTD